MLTGWSWVRLPPPQPAARLTYRVNPNNALAMKRVCPHHGKTRHIERYGRQTGWRCCRCASEAVSRRRRKMKAILVAEHGGSCLGCGYNKSDAALQFHHVNPKTKKFRIGASLTKGIDRLRKEAKKCVLVCANCHAEIENGDRKSPKLRTR